MRRPHDHGDARVVARRLEMLLFLVVCAVGVYALGSGMLTTTGLGGAIDIARLAIVGASIWILFSQMGRVHDSWPRRNAEGVSASGSGSKANPSKADMTSKVSADDRAEVTS